MTDRTDITILADSCSAAFEKAAAEVTAIIQGRQDKPMTTESLAAESARLASIWLAGIENGDFWQPDDTDEEDNRRQTRIAVLAQAHATLAIAEHLARIADALERQADRHEGDHR